MRGADSNTPAAAGRPRRFQRPGFSYQIRLVGGEAGRRLEREQAEAITEVLRRVAANRDLVPPAAVRAVPQAGSGPAGPVPGEVLPDPGEVGGRTGWSCGHVRWGLSGSGGRLGRSPGWWECIRGRCAAGSARPRVDGRNPPAPRTLKTSRARIRRQIPDSSGPAACFWELPCAIALMRSLVFRGCPAGPDHDCHAGSTVATAERVPPGTASRGMSATSATRGGASGSSSQPQVCHLVDQPVAANPKLGPHPLDRPALLDVSAL